MDHPWWPSSHAPCMIVVLLLLLLESPWIWFVSRSSVRRAADRPVGRRSMPPPCQACALDRCSRPYSVQRLSSTEDHLLSSRLASARSSPSREHSSEAGKRGGAFPTSQSSRPSFIRSPRTDTCSIGSRATPSRVMRAWPSTGKTDPAKEQEGHLGKVDGGRRGQGTIHCDGGVDRRALS